MITFEMIKGVATVYDSRGSEDGWVFEFNPETHMFNIWDNAERHVMGEEPGMNARTLEEVFDIVKHYT